MRSSPCHGQLCDIEFGLLGPARQSLDRGPVQIARGKVHAGRCIPGQHPVDKGDPFEKVSPVDPAGQTQARDHITDGRVSHALLLQLIAHGGLDRRALGGQAVIQPGERPVRPRIVATKAVGELHGKGAVELHAGRHRNTARAVILHRLRHLIGRLPGRSVIHHQFGNSAKVFNQYNADRDGHGPQFANGERLHVLVGQDEPA